MEDDIKGAPEEGQAGEEPRVADVLAEAWDEVEAKEADDEPEAEEKPEEAAPAGEVTPEEEPGPEEASEEEEPEPEGVGTSAPEHWSQADKDNFASMPVEHREWFLGIRKSLERGYQEKFEETAGYRKEREALDEVFKPHDEEIALSGSDRVGAIRQLLAAHRKTVPRHLEGRHPKCGAGLAGRRARQYRFHPSTRPRRSSAAANSFLARRVVHGLRNRRARHRRRGRRLRHRALSRA
ncbi:MAG: hypothetical protein QF902_04690 [Rhodospirillales bacterium]|jgi:hypothetical protein|nr:hypothetical protein [Rhodospirillales bacterium]